jgi:hypothetical protein
MSTAACQRGTNAADLATLTSQGYGSTSAAMRLLPQHTADMPTQRLPSLLPWVPHTLFSLGLAPACPTPIYACVPDPPPPHLGAPAPCALLLLRVRSVMMLVMRVVSGVMLSRALSQSGGRRTNSKQQVGSPL